MSDTKRKILLIDDNDDILDLLEIILYRNYDIITAQNGFEGLDKAREDMPACIITDIMMPVMDGIKFINNLKKSDAISHIPVIAITSFIKKMNTRSLKNIGFSEVITKPLQRDMILPTVNTVMDAQTTNEKQNTETSE